MLGMGKLDLDDLAAELGDRAQRGLEGFGDRGLDALGVVREVARDADPQPREVAA